jgi:hypothetical protein
MSISSPSKGKQRLVQTSLDRIHLILSFCLILCLLIVGGAILLLCFATERDPASASLIYFWAMARVILGFLTLDGPAPPDRAPIQIRPSSRLLCNRDASAPVAPGDSEPSKGPRADTASHSGYRLRNLDSPSGSRASELRGTAPEAVKEHRLLAAGHQARALARTGLDAMQAEAN